MIGCLTKSIVQFIVLPDSNLMEESDHLLSTNSTLLLFVHITGLAADTLHTHISALFFIMIMTPLSSLQCFITTCHFQLWLMPIHHRI